MPILNYTTSVNVDKTIGEIHKILARAGAKSVVTDYDGHGNVSAVCFIINVGETTVNFRLPCKYDAIYHIISSDYTIPKKFRTGEQAMRVAWRIVKDWCEAQMALIEAEQAELAEVFLPYAITKTGVTMFQAFRSGLMLGPGEDDNDDYREDDYGKD